MGIESGVLRKQQVEAHTQGESLIRYCMRSHKLQGRGGDTCITNTNVLHVRPRFRPQQVNLLLLRQSFQSLNACVRACVIYKYIHVILIIDLYIMKLRPKLV